MVPSSGDIAMAALVAEISVSADSWILAALHEGDAQRAAEDAARRRLLAAFDLKDDFALTDEQLRFIADTHTLRVFVLLDQDVPVELRRAATDAFQVARVLPHPTSTIEASTWLLHVACLGVLGDRGPDVRRMLEQLPELPVTHEDWGLRVWASVLDVWLRLFRKHGWGDLDEVCHRVVTLRACQREFEPQFLAGAEERRDVRPAWELIVKYHLAKAAEILATYSVQGAVDGHYDIREQLEAQFDRALGASERARLMELESLTRLLSKAARALVDNSIWTVTRAVNSRVTKFVESLTSRTRKSPIFEMLPPQRRTLREEGLLGSGHRSVVVNLPTSSGKTFIAEFRILQALNQFDHERGWVAYLAPTRALVNQLAHRLRRDLSPLGVVVEKVSPALEVDGLEAEMLTEAVQERQFRLLVTTPEKLDLMLRGDWKVKIGRPLTLVIVDEAHGIGSSGRGLKLELLLATINRECREAQFLLLTPFIHNAADIARWLSPDSNKSVEMTLEWSPNDRVIALARLCKGEKRGDFTIRLVPQHTSREALRLSDALDLPTPRPLGLSWSAAKSPGKLAAATAQLLHQRGTIIILADKPTNTWGIAAALKVPENEVRNPSADLAHIKRFFELEMGPDFPLCELLDYGIAVHHAGLSDDTRTLIERLAEDSQLRVLVATTTLAQGVNFPVSGVVFGCHQHPYGQDMTPEEFWNIVGRAGRVDQGDLGIVALAAPDDEKAHLLEVFVKRSVGALNSTLIEMVREVALTGKLLHLDKLSHIPAWSSFVQYLSHTYRQIGDHQRFAAQVEQVLRGTLGFQTLRRTNKGWADSLVRGVVNYAERIKDKPLKLVDATGFSWETVSNTLDRLRNAGVSPEVWSQDLFTGRRRDLQKMIGLLLEVPELREQLEEVTGGPRPNGALLSEITCNWVQGRPLPEIAAEFFSRRQASDDDGEDSGIAAMTRCCQSIFGRLTQSVAWGLSALQSLTLSEKVLEKLPEDQVRTLRNLPARVYYGVNSDEAVALRLLGVPRLAATAMARQLIVRANEPIPSLRTRLRQADPDVWKSALGANGLSYQRVWTLLEG